MALPNLPSPTKVSGKHHAIFEAYYRQMDPKNTGTIQAMDAAKFLKKSALSDVVLSRIWDLSDPNGKGYLDKPGFFVALKLVSLAQCGQVIKMTNIFYETENPPRVGEIPKIIPEKIQSVPINSNDWSMKPNEREKYENLFISLKPVNGLLHGNSVKRVLMDSKLPIDTLGKIWDLADQDRDGSLDKHEFLVAMHLVYQALEKRAVPEVLPLELQKPKPGATPPPKPPAPVGASMPKAPSGGFNDGGFVANFPKDIGPPPVPPLPIAAPTIPTPIPPLSSVPPTVPSSIQPIANLISTEPIIPTATAPITQQPVDWVITPSELIRYETMFKESDRDKDGLVSGLEVKNLFLQSGVQQHCLAHIWALCDTHQTGKLTLEQFALAMWMVERKQLNIEPPEALTPNMVPPSLRAVVKGVDVVAAEPKPTYSNPELEMISKEIEELSKERQALMTEIAQKEADIRIKNGEIRSLQSELDTLTATLKQLENQKGEAQKRLDDLKSQVNKIREQCQKQEETINEQEGELNAKRSELQKLKDEEMALEKEYEQNRQEMDKLTNQLSYTQLGISQIRATLTQLLELERQMTDALLLCKAAVESQDTHIVSEYSLQIQPDFEEPRQLLKKKFEPPKEEENKPDPFSAQPITTNDTITTRNISDGFGDHDTFSTTNVTNNGWGDGDAFSAKFDDGFGGDAFASQKTTSGLTSQDPFGDARQASTSPIPPGKDDFGSDPFAALHAPTGQGKVLSPNTQQKTGPPPRPESPSPALPPKKSKQPPPRPAPPRPLQGPTRPAPPVQDAFGSPGGGGFADFDDFDNKQPFLPPPPPIPLLNNNKENTKSKQIDNTLVTSKTTTNSPSSVFNINSNTINQKLPSTPIFDSFSTCNTVTINNNVTTISNTINTTNTTNDTLKNNHNITVSNILKNYQRPITPKSNNEHKKTETGLGDKMNVDENNFYADFMNKFDQITSQHDQTKDKSNSINSINKNKKLSEINVTENINNKNNNKINANSIEVASKVIPVTSNVPAPVEFADDPFKDYRYEDIFNIKDDPFADDAEVAAVNNIIRDIDDDDEVGGDTESSEDPFSSDAKKTPLKTENLNQSITKSCELLENFKITPVSSPIQRLTPTPQNSIPKSSSLITPPQSKKTDTTESSQFNESNTKSFQADFANFDAFKILDTNATGKNNSNDDDFFNSNFKTDFENNTETNKTTSPNFNQTKKNDFTTDFSKNTTDKFFDAFNDNFIINNSSITNTTVTNTTNSKKQNFTNDPFADAFGDNPTKKLSESFEANFEDNFFKSDTPEKTNISASFTTLSANTSFNNNNLNNLKSTKNNNNLDPFGDASFGDEAFAANFENFQKPINNEKSTTKKSSFSKNDLKAWSFNNSNKDKKTMLSNDTKNINTKDSFLHHNQKSPTSRAKLSSVPTSSSDKVLQKFADDYSKPDTFDADFEEALRRSMVEK